MFSKLFNQENPIIRTLSRIFDLTVLNFLWLVFSLPFFTMGCATTAAASVCFRMIRDDYTGVTATFWRSFKTSFKDTTQVWLLMLTFMALLGLDLWYFLAAQDFISGVLLALICVILVFLVMTALLIGTYAITMIALFENTFRMTLHNAVLFALRNPARDLAILAVDIAMAGITVFLPIIIPPLTIGVILLGASLTIFLNCKILVPIYKPYLNEENQSEPDVADDQ